MLLNSPWLKQKTAPLLDNRRACAACAEFAFQSHFWPWQLGFLLVKWQLNRSRWSAGVNYSWLMDVSRWFTWDVYSPIHVVIWGFDPSPYAKKHISLSWNVGPAMGYTLTIILGFGHSEVTIICPGRYLSLSFVRFFKYQTVCQNDFRNCDICKICKIHVNHGGWFPWWKISSSIMCCEVAQAIAIVLWPNPL